jgi:hypothetical protein
MWGAQCKMVETSQRQARVQCILDESFTHMNGAKCNLCKGVEKEACDGGQTLVSP